MVRCRGISPVHQGFWGVGVDVIVDRKRKTVRLSIFVNRVKLNIKRLTIILVV